MLTSLCRRVAAGGGYARSVAVGNSSHALKRPRGRVSILCHRAWASTASSGGTATPLANTGLVECVPNFSEGRDSGVLDAIADSCRATEGCTLLDVDPGASTNRTVFTFVGTPAAVVDGAMNMAKTAKDLIDMTKHSGEHPRFGAMDVCPFVPIKDATMDDCIACAHEFGRRAGEELGLPIYMYENASTKGDHRYYLSDIRVRACVFHHLY